MDKLVVPGQMGYLCVNEDGAVLNSKGDLENDEHVAEVLYAIVKTVNKRGPLVQGVASNFHRLSIHYGSHQYSIVLSNKKFHVLKHKYLPNDPVPA